MTEFVERIIYQKKQDINDREVTKESIMIDVIVGGEYGPDFDTLTADK